MPDARVSKLLHLNELGLALDGGVQGSMQSGAIGWNQRQYRNRACSVRMNESVTVNITQIREVGCLCSKPQVRDLTDKMRFSPAQTETQQEP
jgi:hypothetical protein